MITGEDPPASGATRVDQHRSVGAGQPGDSNRPAENAEATCQTGASTQNLAMNAAAAALTAATASAHPDPAGPGNTGSGASARVRRVNTTRTASTRAPKRRNQPRTVPAGDPAARRPGDARHHEPSPPAPHRSPRRCPPAGAATTPAAAHASPDTRCTATAAARPEPHRRGRGPSGPEPGPNRPAHPRIPDTPADPIADAPRPRPSRSLP
jgi:hypothetical protein